MAMIGRRSRLLISSTSSRKVAHWLCSSSMRILAPRKGPGPVGADGAQPRPVRYRALLRAVARWCQSVGASPHDLQEALREQPGPNAADRLGAARRTITQAAASPPHPDAGLDRHRYRRRRSVHGDRHRHQLERPKAGNKKATQETEVPTSPPADTVTTPPDSTPDVTSPPASAPSELAVGDTGSFTSDGGGAADITVTKVDAATREPGEFGDTPEHGWFVILHVTETGTGGSYDVNPLDFYAKASNGFHAEDTAIVTHWGPSLDYGTLHDGEHLSGTLVYDVPTRHGKLVYSPNYQGEPLASWSY